MIKHNISVALATYDGSIYLEEQLASIINQTYPPKEIIIVDDFSTDNTVAIINNFKKIYPSIFLYLNEENLGPIKTFKKAISKCSFDYVALSDQDDIWENNKLEICYQELISIDKVSRPSIVFSDLKIIDSDGNLIGSSFWKDQGYNTINIQFQNILIGNIVTGCTVMMNGSMKREIEKMPNNIIMHDYWMALIAFGIGDFKVMTQTPIRYRVHSNSVTIKSKKNIFNRVQSFLNIFTDFKNIYLSENIVQAEFFLIDYGTRLNEKNIKELKKFISLKKKSSFIKKIHIACLKYFHFW